MKRLLVLLVSIISIQYANSSEGNSPNPGDSIDIKKWTKEDFLKKFNFNDTSYALINLFFTKNKRGKTQTIIGGAFLAGGTVALAIPSEPGDDQIGFGDLVRPVVEPGAATLGAIITTSGIIKLGRYTKEKLFILLSSFKNGSPIPKQYAKKLNRKYFSLRLYPNPKS